MAKSNNPGFVFKKRDVIVMLKERKTTFDRERKKEIARARKEDIAYARKSVKEAQYRLKLALGGKGSRRYNATCAESDQLEKMLTYVKLDQNDTVNITSNATLRNLLGL